MGEGSGLRAFSKPERTRLCDEPSPKEGNFARQIRKAVTLVMLQPPTPAREPTTRTHAPSQPLMQSPLSRNRTPAAPRRVRRFFRVRPPTGSPRLADHPAYFGLANLLNCQPFRPSTKVRLRRYEFSVNARKLCSAVENPAFLLKKRQFTPEIHRKDAKIAKNSWRSGAGCSNVYCSFSITYDHWDRDHDVARIRDRWTSRNHVEES